MKLTMSRKLLFSYLAMAFLTILASTYAIVSLHRMNRLAHDMINQDFLLLDTSKAMTDALLAQESAETKYLILKDPSLAEIFWTRHEEFRKALKTMEKHTIPGIAGPRERLARRHDHYGGLFRREASLVADGREEDAQAVSQGQSRPGINTMLVDLRDIEHAVDRNIDKRLDLVKRRGIEASRITVVLSVISLLAGISLAVIITVTAARPLRKLERATTLIADGKFDVPLDIKRKDEIGRLAAAFGIMMERLKVLEARNLDASPLTGLPGNRVIEEEIERRIAGKVPFALCHVDLDNFKPFADKYGYAWGSEVIKKTGTLLTEGIGSLPDDFVGHIGGDDFVIIADPMRAKSVCPRIVARFAEEVRGFYSEDDLQRGFILGKDRAGKEQEFPLITITVAMVVDDGSRFANALEMAEKAAELKEYAKSLPGSNFVCEEEA